MKNYKIFLQIWNRSTQILNLRSLPVLNRHPCKQSDADYCNSWFCSVVSLSFTLLHIAKAVRANEMLFRRGFKRGFK